MFMAFVFGKCHYVMIYWPSLKQFENIYTVPQTKTVSFFKIMHMAILKFRLYQFLGRFDFVGKIMFKFPPMIVIV